MRHENLIPFIGASVDHGHVAILTAYSARGSLEDVLKNEDLNLDQMFVSSLVTDILKVNNDFFRQTDSLLSLFNFTGINLHP